MAKPKSALTCGCPVAAFQKMISGKYKLRIVWDLKDGPLRDGKIRAGLLRGAMAADEADIVAERQQFFLDRIDQRGVAAAGQIRAPDRAIEQHVADMGEA